jgi:hypothetical protein
MWMQDGCKVYMDSYMAWNGSCFMVILIIFKSHLLEVSPTQNRETITLWMLTTVDLFYFIMCKDLHEQIFIVIAIWLRAQSHVASDYTWESMTKLHEFGFVLGWPLDTFIWALTISRHGSWLVCEVAFFSLSLLFALFSIRCATCSDISLHNMSHVVKTLGVTLVLINDATSNLGANWVNIGIGINDIQFVMFNTLMNSN